MNKKVGLIVLIMAIVFISNMIYKHQQPPTQGDVFDSTENWAPSTEEVFLIEKVNDDWLTIFRNQHSIMIAKLEQNWVGDWEIRDDRDRVSNFATINYPHEETEQLVWSASEGKYSYYFGQVLNPEIITVQIETDDQQYENAELMSSNGKTFFFKRVDYRLHTPINIRGLSESGQELYLSYPTKNTP